MIKNDHKTTKNKILYDTDKHRNAKSCYHRRFINQEDMHMINFAWMILMGFIVGLVARALHPGQDNLGCFYTIALGIVGAMVAGFIGRSIGWYEYGEPAGFVMSVLGAILTLALLGRIGKRR